MQDERMNHMAFFDELGRKISKTSQGVVRKTKDFADTTKLGGLISDEEKQIDALYHQIGQAYFDMHKDDPEYELSALVAAVHDAQNRIEQYRDQINQINGIMKCPNCGTDVPNGSLFCNGCGTRMPEKEQPEPVAAGVPCAVCGALVAEGMRFCSCCGADMQQIKICPQCGNRLADEMVFCNNCGAKVQ